MTVRVQERVGASRTEEAEINKIRRDLFYKNLITNIFLTIVTGGDHYRSLKIEATKLFKATQLLPKLANCIQTLKKESLSLHGGITHPRHAIKYMMIQLKQNKSFEAFDDNFLRGAILVISATTTLKQLFDEMKDLNGLQKKIIDASKSCDSLIKNFSLSRQEIQLVRNRKNEQLEQSELTFDDLSSQDKLERYQAVYPTLLAKIKNTQTPPQ